MGPDQAGARPLTDANAPTRTRLSPNQDGRPDGTPIDTIVLHYTGMRSAHEAVDRLCDPDARVSSHYVVDEDGTVWSLVPEQRRAYHAGISFWRGYSALNDRSIGIEIVNPGHEWGYRPFPPAQMAAVRWLCHSILMRNPIDQRNIVGHSDVAPDRKQDPGELFDWAGLAAAGIGLWPDSSAPSPIVTDDTSAVRAALAAIGYPPMPEATLLTAFQRRWRPSSVTGMADEETRRVLAAVVRLHA